MTAESKAIRKILQDRNHDGIIDAINAKIYVADRAEPEEIAAAANIAARLAFETLSMDLPIGFAISDYRSDETTVAIVVGTAADRFAGISQDGSRHIIAIPDLRDAEQLSRTLGTHPPGKSSIHLSASRVRKSLSLATLFSTKGLLSDPDGDFIPEGIDTTLVLGPDVHSIEVIDLAARLALEATGVHLPLAVVSAEHAMLQNAVLIGLSNPWIQQLIDSGDFEPDMRPGHGCIEVIEHGPGNNSVLVIAGADAEGEAEAIRHAAQRLPYAWEYGKDRLHLSTIENDIRRFFSRRSPAGQAAIALHRAQQAVTPLHNTNLESATLRIFVEGDCHSYSQYLSKQFPKFDAAAASLDTRTGPVIFEDIHRLIWEVRDARRQIEKKVIPRIHAGSAVDLELRVSESPELRAKLCAEIRKMLLDGGADPEAMNVRVLSAYKQGYHWIDEELKPLLKNAARIRIFFKPTQSENTEIIESPIRWLQELYPIDEILARDLGIPVQDITFHKIAADGHSTYEVIAERAGSTILRSSFDPAFVDRPMFDRFPDYARVRVTTGWLRASVDDNLVVDARIKTDPERFWDRYQSKTLPKIHDYLLQLYEGCPQPKSAPYFDTLEVELWLSEPDYRIDIDEERISSLEAIHEDIYFETLLFFDVMGSIYSGEKLTYPGRIIPRIHPAREGRDGLVRIRFTGKAGPNPRMDLQWKEHGRPESRHTENLWPIDIEPPRIKGLTVRAGHRSVVSLHCEAPSSDDARAMIAAVREFHTHGFGVNWLSYEGIDALRFGSTEIPGTEDCYRMPRIEAELATTRPIVQWETPIGPDECEQLIAQLAQFPEVRPFHAGTSYLGHSVWAIDVMAKLDGKYFSQAKASATKPVLFITGRQHANEVSSTSHILRFVERLATNPEYKKLLERVNFIIHPIANPDGAALLNDLRKLTPDFMLHACYLGALGMDITDQQWNDDPKYPEGRVRRELWEMWLPDVVLNPHGYPSHEWVQLFAGYTAWVRSRTIHARSWWIPRGWFMPGFGYIEDAPYPHHKATAFAIRDRAALAIDKLLRPLNERMVRRYAKYGEWDPETYRIQIHNNVLIYSNDQGSRPNAEEHTFMERYPQVTVLETVSEAPDETARDEWLGMIAEAGLAFSRATAEFLAESEFVVERTICHEAGNTELKMFRKRPILPPEM